MTDRLSVQRQDGSSVFRVNPCQEMMLKMQRRDFVKAIMAAATAAAAPAAVEAQQQQAPPAPSAPAPNLKPNVTQAPQAPGPVPWMRGLDEVRALPIVPISIDAVGETETQFFTNAQTATLKRLAELFQPAFKKYPSALEAGAPAFIDFLIGASPAERQHMYQMGLDRLDKEAHQKFGVAFAATDAGQADQLIRPWLRTWMGELPPTEPYARFINVVHLDLRTATINSQAWAEVEHAAGKEPPNTDLYWHPVDPDIHHEMAKPAARVAKRVH